MPTLAVAAVLAAFARGGVPSIPGGPDSVLFHLPVVAVEAHSSNLQSEPWQRSGERGVVAEQARMVVPEFSAVVALRAVTALMVAQGPARRHGYGGQAPRLMQQWSGQSEEWGSTRQCAWAAARSECQQTRTRRETVIARTCSMRNAAEIRRRKARSSHRICRRLLGWERTHATSLAKFVPPFIVHLKGRK